MKFLDSLTNKIIAVIEPFANRMYKMTFLVALSESMQLILPVIIAGSFSSLFATLDVKFLNDLYASVPLLKTIFQNGQALTLSIISVYIILTLPYLYSKKMGVKEPLISIALTVAAFLLVTPTELSVAIPVYWLGQRGMFIAFLASYIVVRVLKLCQVHNISIKMPSGVPPFVETAFATLIPGFFIVFGFSILGQLMTLTTYGSIHQMIYTFIQMPFTNIGGSFFGALITQLISNLAMFCGVHGSSVVPWLHPVMTALSEENLAAVAAGLTPPNTYAYGILGIFNPGGVGATLGVGILLFFLTKSKRYKKLGRVAIIPQLFNISEPILFGLPIMLNPILFIPYISCTVINVCIGYGAIAFGLVAPFSGIRLSWIIPQVIQQFISSTVPWQGALLSVFVIVVDMVIWYPFIRMIDKKALEEEQIEEQQALEKA